MAQVDALTKEIIEKLDNGDFNEIDLILDKRFLSLKELVQLGINDNNDNTVYQYLVNQKIQDEEIMSRLQNEQMNLKCVFKNINQLKDYIE